MNIIRSRSITNRLMFLAGTSAAVALLLASTIGIVRDWRAMWTAKAEQMRTQAEIIAFNSTTAVADRDERSATRLLSALASDHTIEIAALYDDQHQPIAQYYRNCTTSLPTAMDWMGHRFTENSHLEWQSPIQDRGEIIGSVYLRASLRDVGSRMTAYLWTTAGVAICCFGIALVLARKLQRSISIPILNLAKATHEVTANGNFSQRVSVMDADELGALYTSFNRMLEHVETSHGRLQAHQVELEQRVAERTSQLVAEISEREQTQRELQRAKDAAESANRAKSEFLANISHEIRTPLTAILGFTDLLREGKDHNTDEWESFVNAIHNSGRHLLGLLNDMLDLSKIEAGQFKVESVGCSPSQIVAEVTSIMRARAKEKGLQLDYNWVGPIPTAIQSDPARLRQLLLNVLGNAIKFTEDGRVQLLAQIIHADERPQLQIQVVDTGIGIHPDKLDQIFTPFGQADTSVTRRYGGTGLGLAICRRIAEAMGGSVEVDSAVGTGSIFTVRVATGPLSGCNITDQPAGDLLPESPYTSPTVSQRLAGIRVLVADDGDTNRRLIQVMLQRVGAVVELAENGQQAVDRALAQPFDLVLMDMQMPVMDGYTATRRLRQAGLTIPIVALTAHAMKGDEDKGRAAGCSDYLTKPIDRDRLLNAIAHYASQNASQTRTATPTPPATNHTNAERDAIHPTTASRTNAHATLAQGRLESTLPTDDTEFREIVEEFIERFCERLERMRTYFELGDYPRLVELAHWLKGAGGTAGFLDLTRVAGELEQAARDAAKSQAAAALDQLDGLANRIAFPQPT